MEDQSKILIVDDDPNICELLKLYLAPEGYLLDFAHDGSQALDLFRRWQPDLIILDLMLPLIGGIEVCRLIREKSNLPIIMLTAREATEDKIAGLDCGADDYVVKPFDPREVAARVRARLRSSGPARSGEEGWLLIDNLGINIDRFEVRLDGKPVQLTPRELRLLHYLAEHRNWVMTREQLLEQVWGYDYPGGTRTIDMHIKKLREKLHSGRNKWQIRTIYGVGYKFEVIP